MRGNKSPDGGTKVSIWGNTMVAQTTCCHLPLSLRACNLQYYNILLWPPAAGHQHPGHPGGLDEGHRAAALLIHRPLHLQLHGQHCGAAETGHPRLVGSIFLFFPSLSWCLQAAINSRESFCLRIAWPSCHTRLAQSGASWPTWWTTWRSCSSRQRRAAWTQQTLAQPSLCSTTCRNRLQAFVGKLVVDNSRLSGVESF